MLKASQTPGNHVGFAILHEPRINDFVIFGSIPGITALCTVPVTIVKAKHDLVGECQIVAEHLGLVGLKIDVDICIVYEEFHGLEGTVTGYSGHGIPLMEVTVDCKICRFYSKVRNLRECCILVYDHDGFLLCEVVKVEVTFLTGLEVATALFCLDGSTYDEGSGATVDSPVLVLAELELIVGLQEDILKDECTVGFCADIVCVPFGTQKLTDDGPFGCTLYGAIVRSHVAGIFNSNRANSLECAVRDGNVSLANSILGDADSLDNAIADSCHRLIGG